MKVVLLEDVKKVGKRAKSLKLAMHMAVMY